MRIQTGISLFLVVLFLGGACKNRNSTSGSTNQSDGLAERIPEFYLVMSKISEVRIEQDGQPKALKVNAAMRPEEFNGLIKGIQKSSMNGDLASTFTHQLDFRYPDGGIFADYDIATNCLHFKDLGPLENGGAVIWPEARFVEAMKGCAAFWEGYPEE